MIQMIVSKELWKRVDYQEIESQSFMQETICIWEPGTVKILLRTALPGSISTNILKGLTSALLVRGNI